MRILKISAVVMLMVVLGAGSVFAGGSTLRNNIKFQVGGSSTGYPTQICKPDGHVNFTLVSGAQVMNPTLIGGKCNYPGPQQAGTPWVDNSIAECYDPGKAVYYEGCTFQN